MNTIRLQDTISGREGKAYGTIDGSNRELFELSALSANINLITTSKRMLGSRMTQHKVIGAEGTGNMTMYFANSDMLRQTLNYIRSGRFRGLTLQVINEDPASTIGKQEVVLTNVIPSTIPVAYLDDSSDDPITVDTDITFDGIEGLSFFKLPDSF